MKKNLMNIMIKLKHYKGLDKNRKIEKLENELIGQKKMIIDLENK